MIPKGKKEARRERKKGKRNLVNNIYSDVLFKAYGVLGFWGFGEIGRAHV